MSDINVNASLDIGKNIQSILEQLAAKIGTTVEQIWPWMVKAQVIAAWTKLAVFSLLLVVFLFVLYLGTRAYQKDKYNVDVYIPLLMVGGLGSGFTLFSTAIGMSSWVQQIMNPEYCALKELIGMVK